MIQGLPSELEAFIRSEIASGKFRSREDVIAEALRQLREREEKRDRLRDDIQQGLDELDRGDRIPGDEVFSALRRGAGTEGTS